MKHRRGCPLFTHPSQRPPDHPTDCRCSQFGPRLKIDGQPMRVLRYLREHPGASSLEITQALLVINVTGRVSDLRAAGYVIDCRRDPEGVDRYFVREPRPGPIRGEQQGMAL